MDVSLHPSRSFIRHTVRSQLLADSQQTIIPMVVRRYNGEQFVNRIIPMNCSESCIEDDPKGVDEGLLEEICKTCFNPTKNPGLYEEAGTVKQARMIEFSLITEIVQAYRDIQANRSDAIVQKLNSLLLDKGDGRDSNSQS